MFYYQRIIRMGIALLVFASAVGMATNHRKVITPERPFDQKEIYYVEVSHAPHEMGSDQAHAVTDKSAAKGDWKAQSPQDVIPPDSEKELSNF